MRKAEFLQELREALQGAVPAAVIQENISYYDNYISQEAARGRREEEIIEEIGGPRLIAKTIIESSEAAGAAGSGYGSGSYQGGSYGGGGSYTDSNAGNGYGGYQDDRNVRFHYIDLNKWYWKLLAIVVAFLVLSVIFTILGGIFGLLLHFAGPLILIYLIYRLFKGMR